MRQLSGAYVHLLRSSSLAGVSRDRERSRHLMNADLVEVVALRDSVEVARRILSPGEYLIGRAADCALHLDDAALSAQHARVRVAASGPVLIEDLGSANGTFLNDQPVSGATPWPPGARLRIGGTVLNLAVAADPATIPESLYTPPSPAPLSPFESANASAASAGGDGLLRRQLRLTTRQAQQLEIGREVARGGMGAVRTAHESATRRTVAMKVMLQPESPQDGVRFITEARITAQLEHPNIVPIYDLGLDAEGQPFYTMKLVEGITLMRVLQLLKEGVRETVERYPLSTLLTIFQKLCDALAFAHARGVIHRDLKPANIMLGKYGEVLVMDWGLAKIIGAKQPASPEGVDPAAETALSNPHLGEEETFNTHVGAILGTPQYMSPEQARGEIEELDARSDIFVLGLILYEILTLERAFSGRNSAEIISRVAEFEGPLPMPVVRIRHLPGGDVPESLAAVVHKATAPEKDRRYSAVAELQHDLEAYQNGFATSAEKAGIGRQIRLLIGRHKGVFSTLATAWVVITALAVWFIINLHASEQKARHSAEKALVEKEAARRAYARSQITMADEAFRRSDVAAMVVALDSCPEEMRDQSWQYLAAKRDASLGDFKLTGFEAPVVLTDMPGRAGQFALANDRGEIAIANVTTGRAVKTIKTGRGGIKILTVSGDGRQLLVGRNVPAQVELYDTATGARLKSLALPGDVIQHCALGRDGGVLAVILAAGNEKVDLLLFDTRTGVMRWKRSGQFSSVAIHPDGDRLMVAGNARARNFILMKAQDGSDISKLSAFVFSQALSPDGKTLAIGTQTGDLLLLDSATGAELQRGKLHASALRALTWTPDGDLLTMGGEGKLREGRWVFKLWNAAELTPMASFFGLKSGTPVRWSFNASSGHLLTEENPPRLWRIPVGRETVTLPQTSDQGWSGCFLSDTVVVARKAFVLTRYDLGTPGKAVELSPTFPLNYTLAASHWPSGLFALAKNVGPEPFGLKIMAIQGGAVVEKLNRPVQGRIHALDFDGPAEHLVAVSQNGGVLVYSVKTGELQLKVPGRFEHAVFAGGDRNVIALNARTLKADEVENDLMLLDGTGGKTLATVTNRYRVNALAASPGRAIVATGGTDQCVHIYDAATLQERISFRAHDSEIDALAFHPTASIIATASADGAVKLWDYRSGKQLDYFLGLGGMPAALAFSPNGRLLLVDGQERTTRIYDVSGVKAP
jgi:serine/threonine protein kinase/WD40 repeat protein